jgi:hypothetical protein
MRGWRLVTSMVCVNLICIVIENLFLHFILCCSVPLWFAPDLRCFWSLLDHVARSEKPLCASCIDRFHCCTETVTAALLVVLASDLDFFFFSCRSRFVACFYLLSLGGSVPPVVASSLALSPHFMDQFAFDSASFPAAKIFFSKLPAFDLRAWCRPARADFRCSLPLRNSLRRARLPAL